MISFKKIKLSKRLLIYIIILILLSCLTVGITSYYIAKKALDAKGKIILKNGVKMALLLIDAKNKDVMNGTLSLEEAQEQVKIYLLGKKNQNGTRRIQSKVDLGQNGYFIVYSRTGVELMHPVLEGKNVWTFKDKSPAQFLLVQDQVNKAMAGGGYTYYTWDMPNSNLTGKKVSYSEFEKNWNWIVTASSYMVDYNKGANNIMIVMVISTIIMLLLGVIISRNYIKVVTAPIERVVNNMKLAEKGHYSSIIGINRTDEIGDLIIGFNEMVNSINYAHLNLISQEKKIRHLAYYDQLSDLPNRNMFKEHVNSRIEANVSRAHLILMDIKDFKFFNSILGNEFGDQLIGVIGLVLKKLSSEDIFIARLSGNEFALWIENSDDFQVKQIMNTFRGQFAEEIKNIDFNQRIYFHISYCSYEEDGLDFESYYKKAAIALNFAKDNSPNKIFKFERVMADSIENEALIRNHLEKAILNKEFEIYYQNKVRIKDTKIVGVEALARWNSKILGPISPAVFIPSIDKANLTTKFSKMIIEKVLKDYPRVEEKLSQNISVSINISPLFFFEKDFTSFIIKSISNSGVKAENVILEITEDIFINDFNSIQRIISELKSFGIRISLDDFGTGYSSLNYLKNLDLDELKIDKSLMQGILTDERDLKLLKAIELIAKAYGYSVVAEGIETNEQLEKIIEANFDIVQGYIYSKPEPL